MPAIQPLPQPPYPRVRTRLAFRKRGGYAPCSQAGATTLTHWQTRNGSGSAGIIVTASVISIVTATTRAALVAMVVVPLVSMAAELLLRLAGLIATRTQTAATGRVKGPGLRAMMASELQRKQQVKDRLPL